MSITNTDGSKSLGRKELTAIAVGNIIGGGLIGLTYWFLYLKGARKSA